MASPTRTEPAYAPPRFGTQRDPSRKTLGPKAAAVAALLGEPLMPWQRGVMDIALEINPATGFFYYREIRLALPRQQGKTTTTRTRNTFQALAWAKQRLVYTAQSRNMARQRLEEDFYDPIAASPLSAALARTGGDRPGFRAQTGSEHIAFANRSGWWIDAVTKKSGHGPSLDLGTIDEAFAHVDSRIEQAMRPAMMQRPNAQLWVLSTAGDGDSTYWRSKVDDGRERIESGSKDSRVAYFEWSAPDDADPDDPETWRACMPAYGVILRDAIYGPNGEILEPAIVAAGEDLIRAERDAMDDDDFRRAYLNQWVDKKQQPGIIPGDAWAANRTADPDADVWSGEPVWSIDVAPLRTVTSFGLAAAPLEGGADVFLELVGQIEGTEGAVEKLIELRSMFGGTRVALSRHDAAGSLIPALKKAGFEVLPYGIADKADACGWFFDAVHAKKIRHMDDAPLNGAVLAAGKRDKGEGAWIFKRSSLRDITPLYAVLLAGWAYLNNTPSEPYDIADSLG